MVWYSKLSAGCTLRPALCLTVKLRGVLALLGFEIESVVVTIIIKVLILTILTLLTLTCMKGSSACPYGAIGVDRIVFLFLLLFFLLVHVLAGEL